MTATRIGSVCVINFLLLILRTLILSKFGSINQSTDVHILSASYFWSPQKHAEAWSANLQAVMPLFPITFFVTALKATALGVIEEWEPY